ncbi:uncharacterized protein LY79DRAFT_556881 [Colletotrichum navitas]|uniref:Uncharacterized protein n=1 Tax=Colletotrichum navitas TaxID=681940 RepID=A0AAD8PXU8_9PEZI|nr:uncharacterized protein LY79DRAFT_556881 [Colletotrichum navitas]KAK1586096.1 hypothetical protein LY79DRAFT_556881 [Colletotrichum navitas]
MSGTAGAHRHLGAWVLDGRLALGRSPSCAASPSNRSHPKVGSDERSQELTRSPSLDQRLKTPVAGDPVVSFYAVS